VSFNSSPSIIAAVAAPAVLLNVVDEIQKEEPVDEDANAGREDDEELADGDEDIEADYDEFEYYD
jgi:hypothetical protein